MRPFETKISNSISLVNSMKTSYRSLLDEIFQLGNVATANIGRKRAWKNIPFDLKHAKLIETNILANKNRICVLYLPDERIKRRRKYPLKAARSLKIELVDVASRYVAVGRTTKLHFKLRVRWGQRRHGFATNRNSILLFGIPRNVRGRTEKTLVILPAPWYKIWCRAFVYRWISYCPRDKVRDADGVKVLSKLRWSNSRAFE